MNTAQAVRLHKEKHPERYCPKCLWRLSSGVCPKHPAESAAQIGRNEALELPLQELDGNAQAKSMCRFEGSAS